jgi:hypothetical protein
MSPTEIQGVHGNDRIHSSCFIRYGPIAMEAVQLGQPSQSLWALSGRELRDLVWPLAWRGMVVNIVGAAAAAVAGFLAVVVWQLTRHLFGISLSPNAGMTSSRIVGACAGFLVAVPLYVVYLNWLLRARIGAFRLQLVRTSN